MVIESMALVSARDKTVSVQLPMRGSGWSLSRYSRPTTEMDALAKCCLKTRAQLFAVMV